MSTRLQDDLLRTGLAAVSTGGRTFTAFAALAATALPDATGQPDRTLARPGVRGVAGVLALTELLFDKLPMTPSRLEPPGFVGRLVFGGACGAVVARREPDAALTGWPTDPAFDAAADPSALPMEQNDLRTRTIVCAAVGMAVAAASSWCGVRFRSGSSSGLGRDWIGATVEDVAVVALAAAAARAR